MASVVVPARTRPPWRATARLVLSPFTDPVTWTGLVHLLVGVPLGLVWLAAVAVGLTVGGATAVLGVGVPLLLATLALGRALGEVERRLANALLDAGIEAPDPVDRSGSRVDRARRTLRDPRTWRSLAWLLFRAVAGVLVLAGGLVAAVVLVALIVLPFAPGYLQWGADWRSAGGWANAWTPLVGLLGLVGGAHLLRGTAVVHRQVARVLLDPDPVERVAGLEREVLRAHERARLARDLHDSVGHALTLVVVQAEAAAAVLARDRDAAREALHEIGSAGRRALDDLDGALGALRGDAPPPSRHTGLADVPTLVERATAAGLPLALRLPDGTAGIGAAASAAAYRIVQEACTNVLRHAGPVPTGVEVTVEGAVLRVEVRNAPGRAAPAGGGGQGLAGLAERVRLLGGTLRAGPDPDGGWRVAAALPIGEDRR